MTDPIARLDCDWKPAGAGPALLTLTLVNTSAEPFSGFRLAFTALLRIRGEAGLSGGSLVGQVSNHHVIAPPDRLVLAPGDRWTVTTGGVSHNLRHFSYGPKSAYLILADGTTPAVAVTRMTRAGADVPTPALPRPPLSLPEGTPPVAATPWPASVAVAGARPLPAAFAFDGGPPEALAAFAAVDALARRLLPGEPLFAATGSPVAARIEALPPEAYRLDFAPTGIAIAAAGTDGFLRGFVALAQMLRGARLRPGTLVLPQDGTIADAPRFSFRGAHLDVARQVYSVAEILRFVDAMAWNRLNRLHLHLTDDEGWRIDVPGLPQLAAKAAFRGHGLLVPPLLGSRTAPYGIVYAAGDIARIVARAASLGIAVVPEVDIPGHCYAAIEAIPALRDPGETGVYRSIQYFPNNALNPAMPETYAFLETVFGTVADLFPAPWIHVGGDEVADDAWHGSPLARALMRERGWTKVAELQSHFLRKAQAIVRGLGRVTGAWEEAADGGGVAAGDAYLVAWRRGSDGRALAEAGYDVVLAPAEHCYFDMARADDFGEPGASWAGTVTVADSYAFDPGAAWPEALLPRLLGVQSCLWSENLDDRGLFDRLVFPRLSAIAETAWTPRGGKDFRRFEALAALMPASGIGG